MIRNASARKMQKLAALKWCMFLRSKNEKKIKYLLQMQHVDKWTDVLFLQIHEDTNKKNYTQNTYIQFAHQIKCNNCFIWSFVFACFCFFFKSFSLFHPDMYVENRFSNENSVSMQPNILLVS